MKFAFTVFACVIVISCYSQQSKTKRIETRGRQNRIDNMKLYEGIWAEDINENAFFIIKKGRVYNIDDMKTSFVFKIIKDTIVVNYEGFLGKYVVLKISDDSLVIKNEDYSITRLYKRK